MWTTLGMKRNFPPVILLHCIIAVFENRASLAGRRRRGWSRCGGIYERKSPKSVVGGYVTRSLYRRQTVSNRVTTAICRPLIDNNDTIILSAWTASVLPMQRLLHTVSPWQWRNFVPYLCQLVFAAILWVKLLEMFIMLMLLEYVLSVG